MSDGMSDADAAKIANALAAALRAEASTAEKVQRSAATILEGTGSALLAEKIRKTDPTVWAGMWESIRDFLVSIWEGISGAIEGLIDAIQDLF